MDGQSVEQRAANDALGRAIDRVCHAYSDSDNTEMMCAGWVVVYGVTLDDSRLAGYQVLHPGGHQPTHIAEGLLWRGLRILGEGDDT